LLKWVVRDKPSREQTDLIQKSLNVPSIISEILVTRGITTPEAAYRFFRPEWKHLYDPFLMKDMHKAVDRIITAMKNGERILIYGDYDVDGITSVSELYLFLKNRGADLVFYIPDRLQEGYGLSRSGVEKAAEAGATLLITVDCGITGVEEVAYARQLGIDVIVSDHHEQGESLPDAVAILDPKREECGYPFQELAGVGVVFKLIQAISQHLNLDDSEYQKYADLVALGSAADIVPLIDENRVLVNKGLDLINKMERPGIKAMFEAAGWKGQKVSTGQLVFVIAPRINAVGRLGNAERAVRLLISDSEQQTRDMAKVLEHENRNRKLIDEETYRDALDILSYEFDEAKDRAVVLAKEGWHSGVIGIVASRVAEQVYRPTIMISVENGIGKGSARSIASFDIYSAIKKCSDKLVGFGGHRYAAGLTIESDKIDEFKQAFKEVASELLAEDDLVKKIVYDGEIELSDINERFVKILNYFAPFGPRNMRPVFKSSNLKVVGSPRIVGKNHLKFKVYQNGVVFDAIGFDLGNLLYRLSPGEKNLELLYVVEENVWNGRTRVQLRVKDLH